MKSEPWPQLTGAENFTKFGRVFFETREWTDRQTHRHADMLIAILRAPIPAGKVTRATSKTRHRAKPKSVNCVNFHAFLIILLVKGYWTTRGYANSASYPQRDGK